MLYLASCTICTMASLARRSWDVSVADCHSPVETSGGSSTYTGCTENAMYFFIKPTVMILIVKPGFNPICIITRLILKSSFPTEPKYAEFPVN